MTSARYLLGDVFEVMATLPDGSVDLVLTSPPFLALRSYLPPDHPNKGKEIGSEPTPAAFLDTLLSLTAEWRRLLAPHGSIAVELGDTYSGSGGAGGDYGPGGLRDGQQRFDGSASKAFGLGAAPRPARNRTRSPGADWPMDKSLCGIPHLYHLSLAYGRNLLTGEPSPAGQWRVRNVVAWCRPNPPVGALGDKFRPATSYMTIATVARDRYFDLDAVRGAPVEPHVTRVGAASASKGISGGDSGNPDKERLSANPNGAPPLDWWEISTQPYKGAHYATWPMALCERPIKSMVPQRVCTTCGEPSRRIVESQRCLDGEPVENAPAMGDDKARRRQEGEPANWRWSTERQQHGFTDCGHDTWRNGLILDPFAGSGTTLAVAVKHGRDAIGIDLDERNAELALQRCDIGGTGAPNPLEVVA